MKHVLPVFKRHNLESKAKEEHISVAETNVTQQGKGFWNKKLYSNGFLELRKPRLEEYRSVSNEQLLDVSNLTI